MVKHRILPALLIGIAATFSVTGCAGFASTAAGNPSVAQAPVADVTDSIARPLIGGQYNGTIKDSQFGSAKAVLQLAQAGSSVGGSIVAKFSVATANSVTAGSVSGNSISGTQIALMSSPCTFSIKGTFNPKTLVLKGRYTALKRCRGESGSFSYKQTCYYVVPSATAVDELRPHPAGGRPC